MVTRRHLLACALVVSVTGCGDSGDNGAAADGGIPAPPPECALEPPSGAAYPPGPYGQDVGERFADITLDNCDREPVRFGDVLAQSEYTLFNIGAGWCQPCVEETETLDSDIFRQFCGRGLQVVQVVFEDSQSRPATSLFCNEWSQRFSLSFTVLYDPLFLTMPFFEDVSDQTPQSFVVRSSDAEIVFREVGVPSGSLSQFIDGVLPPSQ